MREAISHLDKIINLNAESNEDKAFDHVHKAYAAIWKAKYFREASNIFKSTRTADVFRDERLLTNLGPILNHLQLIIINNFTFNPSEKNIIRSLDISHVGTLPSELLNRRPNPGLGLSLIITDGQKKILEAGTNNKGLEVNGIHTVPPHIWDDFLHFMTSSYVNLLDSELVLDHLKLENFRSIDVPNFPLTSELTLTFTQDGPENCSVAFAAGRGLSQGPFFRNGGHLAGYFFEFFNSRIKPYLELPDRYNITLTLGLTVIDKHNPEWN